MLDALTNSGGMRLTDNYVRMFYGILDGICRQFFRDVKIAIEKKDGYYFIFIKIPAISKDLISGQRNLRKRRVI